MTKNTQTRGNCPLCGAQQAVLKSGRMSKHGYTVKGGWFHGVCDGEHHKPLQQDRSITDMICNDITNQVVELILEVEDLEAGRVTPEFANPMYGDRTKQIKFEDADSWDREATVKRMVRGLRAKIKAGESHVKMMTE